MSSFKSTHSKDAVFSRQEIISAARIKSKNSITKVEPQINQCVTTVGSDEVMSQAGLTEACWQGLYGNGAMAIFHIDWTGNVNKEWWHVQLWSLRFQEWLPLEDAEGVLVLVDCVGVREGLAFVFSMRAMPYILLILHNQICVTFHHDARAWQAFCMKNRHSHAVSIEKDLLSASWHKNVSYKEKKKQHTHTQTAEQ